jgi:hypothetical protein
MSNDQRNEPAYPSQPLDGIGHPACAPNIGLSKRELFAAMAMQGILAGLNAADRSYGFSDVVREARDAADALLAALQRSEQP